MSSSVFLRLLAGLLVLSDVTGTAQGASGPRAPVLFAVSERSAHGALVGRLPDPAPVGTADADSHAFEIVAGNTDETFAIDAATGELRVARPGLLDHEIRPRFELKVRWKRAATADAARRRFAADLLASNVDPVAVMNLFTLTEERFVTIEVLDVDEPPVIPAQTLTLVDDAADRSAASGRIHAADPDLDDALSFEAIAGDPDGLLVLDATTGRVAIAPERTIPAGLQTVPLTVGVSDRAGHSDAATISIRLVGVPAPLIAQPQQTPELVASPPVDAHPPEPVVRPVGTPAMTPEVAAVNASSAPPGEPATGPRHFSRLASWFFLAGALLGAGVMTVVFRYVGRKSQAVSMTTAPAPRNPFGHPRPQPIMVTAAEHLHAIRSSVTSRTVPARTPPVTVSPLPPGTDEVAIETSPDRSPADDEPDLEQGPEAALRPAFDIEPATFTELPTPPSLPGWQDEMLSESPYSPVPPPADQFHPSAGASDWSALDAPPAAATAADELPLLPAVAGPAGWWAKSSAGDEPPHVVALDGGNWISPEDHPAGDVPDAVEVLEVADTLHDADLVPEAADVSDATPGVAPQTDGATLDDGHEAAAVQEAAEALDEAHSPLGVDPRVSELRQQLIELFGVPADRPSLQPEFPPPSLHESSVEFHLAKDVASDSARVDELFESLRAGLHQGPSNVPAAPGGSLSTSGDDAGVAAVRSASDSFVLTPLTPEVQLARAAQAGPASRVNKSAVRQEISSLREVANIHARAIVARQTTEKRARIVWLVSGCCMVPLFSGGTYLLTSMPPGILRWLGWVLLTGGAAAFSICLNSFNRLSRLHEDSLAPDEAASSVQSRAMSDTAEIEIPKQLVAQSDAASTLSPAPLDELPRPTPEQQPVDDGVYVHS